ncbi:MAG: MFS transporter [Nocardioides sp.]
MNDPTRRALVSHALAAVGMSLPWPLLLLVVWEQTSDGLLLGLAGAARMLPYVLFSWCAGRLADRVRRDRIVAWTLGARIVLLALAGVALGDGRTVVAVVAAAAAVAVATPAYPALAAGMPDAAGPRQRRATDLLVTVEVASFVVGPALGGLLLQPVARPLVPVLAVALTVAALALWRGVSLPAPLRGPGSGSRPAVVALLRASAPVRAAVALVALVNLVLAATALALLPLAEDGWGAGGSAYGLATGALGFGALAAPLLARTGRDNGGRITSGLLLMVACGVAVTLSPAAAAAMVPLALAGAAAVVVESAATGVIQEHAPDQVRATVLGVTDTAMVAAAMAGTLLAPLAADMVGPRVLLAGAAVLCLVGLPAVRSVREGGAAVEMPVVVTRHRSAAIR